MFKKQNRQSLNQINIIAIVFAGVFAFISAFIIIFNELVEFENEIEMTEKIFLQNQKRKTVDEVSRLKRLIEYRCEELKDKSLEALEKVKANVSWSLGLWW